VRAGGARVGRVLFGTDAAVSEGSDGRGDDEGTTGTAERCAERLDGPSIGLAGSGNVREVIVDEGRVDDALTSSRSSRCTPTSPWKSQCAIEWATWSGMALTSASDSVCRNRQP
jgi:hypothetical protein